jgi:hypothetical protein
MLRIPHCLDNRFGLARRPRFTEVHFFPSYITKEEKLQLFMRVLADRVNRLFDTRTGALTELVS